MKLPLPQGDLSNALVKYFYSSEDARSSDITTVEATDSRDFHLSLWMLYQLHGTGFADVAPEEEWNPDLIRVRTRLETKFEHELRSRFTDPQLSEPFSNALFAYINDFDGV